MFEIKLPVENLELDARDPRYVEGRIWLRFGEYDFPGESWADAPISVVGSLCDAIEELKEGADSSDFYFFEGSYFVKVVRDSADPSGAFPSNVSIFAVYDGRNGEGIIKAQTTGSLQDVASVCKVSVRTLLSWIDANGSIESRELMNGLARCWCTLGSACKK